MNGMRLDNVLSDIYLKVKFKNVHPFPLNIRHFVRLGLRLYRGGKKQLKNKIQCYYTVGIFKNFILTWKN